MIDRPTVYLDTNVFVDAVEGDRSYADAAQSLLSMISDRVAVTSELTLAEILVPTRDLFRTLARQPTRALTSALTIAEVLVRASNENRERYVQLVLGGRVCDVAPVSADVLLASADYRRGFISGSRPPRLPDAIHVVTARSRNCTHKLSADARLRLPPGMAACVYDFRTISSLVETLNA